jgi:opacity protein-like surface antigen
MMGRNHWIAALAALCLASAPALADQHQGPDDQSKPGFGRSGFYLGVNFAYGLGSFYENAIEDEVPFSVNVDNSVGLNARLGYRLLPFFALEAHYEWLDGFDVKLAGFSSFEQTTHTITGNLKFLLPIWRIQPYLMLGVGAQYYDVDTKLLASFDRDDWVFAGRPALGVDIYLTRHLVLNAEAAGVIAVNDLSAQLSSIDTLPYVSLSAGLQWRF